MLIITTQDPTFGRGFFLGIDKEGFAHFQSCLDHRVKRYKTTRNAEKQLDRIRVLLDGAPSKASYALEEDTTEA